VVLADPDAASASAVAGLLESWGCRVSSAPTLREALLGLRASDVRPELALVDAGREPGRRAAHLRAELGALGCPDLPCVLLVSRGVQPPSDRAGAPPWLHKPIAPARLRTALIRLVRPSPG
jgi:CheY-like chemotaxis protein